MPEPQAPEVPVREGDILAGKYRVERVLGVGGMGVVVAAMHTELEQRVAIKFLNASVAQNPLVVARFAREAKAAAKIKSEHVARVSDVGTMESGLPYMVMEYLEGHDLSHAIEQESRIAPGLAVDYLLQACEAIAEAHAAGFVHRDLKPGNLFLARRADGSEVVKVLDFGISKAVITDSEPLSGQGKSLTQTTDIFGSPLYMSPEQLKSSRDVDARADIWAIGVILYEMLHGKTPFDRPTVAETFGAILYEKPEPLGKLVPGLPAGLDAVVLRCLEKDAAARWQNVAELAKALFPFAEQANRTTLERTSRVLKRAGMAVDTVPPPASAAATNLSPSAQTRTAWTPADGVPKPRSGARTAAFALLGLVVVAGGLFAFTRFGRPRPALPGPDRPVTTQTATAGPSVTPVNDAKPPESAAPSVSAAPAVSVSAMPSAEPVVVPSGTAHAPSTHPLHGKAPAGKASATPSAAPIATSTPVAPTPPPPKPPEDPDDFGPRK
jgi:serine/threonine-protein kinase